MPTYYFPIVCDGNLIVGERVRSARSASDRCSFCTDVAGRAKPETAPARIKRDALLSVEIERVFHEDFQVYGVRKVWRQLLREGYEVARCTVARLMRKWLCKG